MAHIENRDDETNVIILTNAVAVAGWDQHAQQPVLVEKCFQRLTKPL